MELQCDIEWSELCVKSKHERGVPDKKKISAHTHLNFRNRQPQNCSTVDAEHYLIDTFDIELLDQLRGWFNYRDFSLARSAFHHRTCAPA